jgi:hypothetical protein
MNKFKFIALEPLEYKVEEAVPIALTDNEKIHKTKFMRLRVSSE